jgi:hypothetical protein
MTEACDSAYEKLLQPERGQFAAKLRQDCDRIVTGQE